MELDFSYGIKDVLRDLRICGLVDFKARAVREYIKEGLAPKPKESGKGQGRGAQNIYDPATTYEIAASYFLVTERKTQYANVRQAREVALSIVRLGFFAAADAKELFSEENLRQEIARLLAGRSDIAALAGDWLRIRFESEEKFYNKDQHDWLMKVQKEVHSLREITPQLVKLALDSQS